MIFLKNILKEIVIKLMELESSFVLKKYKPKIVAITGNVGKTSIKEAVAMVLDNKYHIRKSEKSFNSEIGVPLTILGCKNAWGNPVLWLKNLLEGLLLILFPNHYPNYLVLEVGTDKPGDIKRIAKWLRPDIVIVNKIGQTPVHIEFFKSVEDLIREKSYIVESMKEGGTLVVNNDDDNSLGSLKYASRNTKIVTFGLKKGSNFEASNYHIIYNEKGGLPMGITFKLDHEGSSLPIKMARVFGKQNIYTAMAALAVASIENINLITATESLLNYDGPKGRLKLIEGINDSVIFDDTYNSSPSAVLAALLFMQDVEVKGRKICVLGDMLELGKHTNSAHKSAGEAALGACDQLYIVGHRAKDIGIGAEEAGKDSKDIFYFNDAISAGKALKEKIISGDTVLVKGSQMMRMERTVEQIMKYPEMAPELLVRQVKEWQNR